MEGDWGGSVAGFPLPFLRLPRRLSKRFRASPSRKLGRTRAETVATQASLWPVGILNPAKFNLNFLFQAFARPH